MNVSRTRKVTINMGNYGERYEASATVTVSHGDLGFTDEDWIQQIDDFEEDYPEEGSKKAFNLLNEFALEAVNQQLEIEVAEALRIRDSDEPSFMDQYEHPEEEKRPRRRNRRRA